jgi:hypothetical protein
MSWFEVLVLGLVGWWCTARSGRPRGGVLCGASLAILTAPSEKCVVTGDTVVSEIFRFALR